MVVVVLGGLVLLVVVLGGLVVFLGDLDHLCRRRRSRSLGIRML